MNLLERAPFLEELAELQRQAASGQGRLVFLGGEAGVGKTVLVQRFCQSLEKRAKVLLGACDPLSTPQPLGPLMDIAGALGGEIGRLLHDAAQRDKIFRSLLAALQRGPMVVVFEDVHWADEATLDLLRFLGRRLHTTRALLIATYRNDEVGPKHPLRIVIGDLATSAAVHRLTLSPLSEKGVRMLAEGTDVDPAELYQQTGGNPFFVTEVLASGARGVPATVRDAVLARAARLSAEGREALEAAAVIGSRVEPQLLNTVLGPAVEAVEECLALGILQSRGDLLAFRHELVREALLEVIPAQRRLTLHKSVLDALASSPVGPDDLARLAHHGEGAQDQEAVLTYAPEAARRAAALRAHREAAAQYARALRFADRLAAAERALLLEAWSYECYLTDRIPEAVEGRTRALELWREAGNRLKEGEALRWLSRLAWFLGRRAEAERSARAALGVLEALLPGPELAMGYSNLAQLKMLAHEDQEAVNWGEKAIALAEQLGDTVTLVHALNNVGTAKLHMGDEGGREQLERSLRLAYEGNLEEHAARALANLASLAVSDYQFALADGYLHEGIAYCTDHDLDSWRLYLLGWRALSLFYRGFWDRATEEAGAVYRHPNVSPVSAIQALVVLGRVRARRGDPEVWPVLDEALELALRTEELQRLGPVYCARAEAAYLAGRVDRALEAAQAAYDLALARKARWLLAEMAYWRWKAGDLSESPAEAATPFTMQISGDWAEAAEEWRRLDCPYEAAGALAEGDDEAALRQALEAFEQLGARPAAQALARRLRELGAKGIPRGPRPSTLANPAQLTRRELQVLALLAEGRSNADIAAALFRSPKTITHHVSAILAKLGASNRTEAVREAIHLGMLGDQDDDQNRKAEEPN